MTGQKHPDEQFCRFCGTVIKKEAEICPDCGVRPGTPVEESASTTYCSACGNSIHNEAELCPNCGNRINQAPWSGWSGDGRDTKWKIQTGLGIVFLLAAVGTLTNGGSLLASIGESMLYGSIGMLLLPQVRERVSVSYPVTTLGRYRSVDELAVENQESMCSVCRSRVEDGVQRAYSEEFVVFGVSTVTLEKGENYYCNDCIPHGPLE